MSYGEENKLMLTLYHSCHTLESILCVTKKVYKNHPDNLQGFSVYRIFRLELAIDDSGDIDDF